MIRDFTNLNTDLYREMIEHFTKATDDLIEKGLKRKGFVFKNRFEMEMFIKNNCEMNSQNDSVYYYVNGEPFLIRKIQIAFDTNTVTAEYEFI